MSSLSLCVVYHPNCKPSTDFLIKVSKLQNAELTYINIKDDDIESELDIDTVPLIIINDDPSKIFKGKQAFDKVDDLLKEDKIAAPKKFSRNKYAKAVSFVEEEKSGKKEKIDISKR